MTITSSLREQRRSGPWLEREPGPGAPAPFAQLHASLLDLVVDEPAHRWRWLVGQGDQRRRRYRVDSAASLGELALSPGMTKIDWLAAVRGIGAALRRLHRLPVAPQMREPIPALRRLASFLTDDLEVDSTRTSSGSRRQHSHAVIGIDVLTQLRADCAAALSPARGVRSHGWAGLNNWYPTELGVTVGLIGEDCGLGEPEHDLGSLLAQVVEFTCAVPSFARICPVDGARTAILDGYRAPIDHGRLDRHIRLSVARHLADYVMYTDGPEDEFARYAHLVRKLPRGDRS